MSKILTLQSSIGFLHCPPLSIRLRSRSALCLAHLPSRRCLASKVTLPPPESDPERFFKYTSGRWIHDEARQLAARYLRFDVDALKEVGAAAGGADRVISMSKLAEGAYNKVFLLVLNNGKEIIARLPTPHAGPGHSITASEVATMDYLHSILGVPVPRVLAWSSDEVNNPVGAEYIIMEKAEGVELIYVWDDMPKHMKCDVVEEWVKLEKLLCRPISGGYGSLYYRKDVHPTLSYDLYTEGVRESRFVIGPSADATFWKGERQHMNIDRGPWKDPLSMLLAIAKRERDWIENHTIFKPKPSFFEPLREIQEPSAHVSLLDQYMAVAPYLIPADPTLVRPALWHTDTHHGNIFLSKEALADEKVVITSVIDWQHACIRPLYLQARTPRFIRYHDPALLSPGLEPAALPDDFSALSEEEQQEALSDVELANRHKLYEALSLARNPEYHRALSPDMEELILMPYTYAGDTWSGGFVPLRESLLRVVAHWNLIARDGSPCPIQFSDEEREASVDEAKAWQRAEDMLVALNARIGVRDDGWVFPEDYDAAVAANIAIREMMVERFNDNPEDTRRRWPYQPEAGVYELHRPSCAK
ncbi:hypothetical protein BOTBODRAFT_107823 [Botryobasidium botryosum FD-172 SS1]|uniref:Uncharacterized protein n=1 Tax=Botryobasidium botryosum (strain FD-172 SS1) TaxID=930990 RepID=A0A067MMA7_BOTB1|nr:hypothetical protein BOTBODRAFT_107823 [Botryobasidium botryosum FD-172 SS1]